MKEFDFIRRYLAPAAVSDDPALIVGVGDDAAIIRPEIDLDWHIAADMSVCGRHFFADDAPADLAHKILAVNLSDMAAMGATPRYALLSAAVPSLEEAWADEFFASFFALARRFSLRLIGGDTTRGPGVFNLTIMGTTPRGSALRRSGARVGDDVWVSGELGLAAAATDARLKSFRLPASVAERCEQKRLRPEPRVALGCALLTVAHAAQDVSDGLWQDAEHIAAASDAGMDIELASVPTADALRSMAQLPTWVLAGGDDYELIFTAAPESADEVLLAASGAGVAVTRIGRVRAGAGVRVFDENRREIQSTHKGFDHFEED